SARARRPARTAGARRWRQRRRQHGCRADTHGWLLHSELGWRGLALRRSPQPFPDRLPRRTKTRSVCSGGDPAADAARTGGTMSPGVGEEVGLTARTVVEALKTTPAILALVIFNLLFLGTVVYVQHTNGERWEKIATMMLEQCGPRRGENQ